MNIKALIIYKLVVKGGNTVANLNTKKLSIEKFLTLKIYSAP
jgi:hypothetical protein